MPIYEYMCTTCGKDFEALQKFSDEPLTGCSCGKSGAVERKLSLSAFQLKGGGWYKDRYGSANGNGKTGSNGSGTTDSAGKSAGGEAGKNGAAAKTGDAAAGKGSETGSAKTSDSSSAKSSGTAGPASV